jgi:hypothetical protein
VWDSVEKQCGDDGMSSIGLTVSAEKSSIRPRGARRDRVPGTPPRVHAVRTNDVSELTGRLYRVDEPDSMFAESIRGGPRTTASQPAEPPV